MTRRDRFLLLLLLAAVTFAAYAGVLRNGWIIVDDRGYVYENPVVSRGLTLTGLGHFLTHEHGANWVPVTAFSHMLDVQLFGLRPAGHHLTSLVLHVVNTLLVALLLGRLTGAWWRGVIVAALFALHPLRVESVAWIAERKDVLSTCFFLLTLYAWTAWTTRPTRGRYALVLVALLLGLWSKPMLITTPFVLLLLDFWPLDRLATPGRPAAAPGAAGRRPWHALVLEKWPLFALVGLVTAVTYRLQSAAEALPDFDFFTFGRHLATALINSWRYLGLLAWPADLAPFHAHGARVDVAGAGLAAAGLVLVTAAALGTARRRPWLAVGWLWYLGTLLPVSGLVQTGSHAWADRFTYIPGLGVLLAVVWSAANALEGRPRPARLAVLGAVGAVLAVLAVATVRQTGFWRDTGTYVQRVMAVEGDNPLSRRIAQRWLGLWLLQENRLAEAKPYLETVAGRPVGVEDRLRRALADRPDDLETRRDLATLLTLETRAEEGIDEYEAILARSPDDLDALNNIAWIRATHEDAVHRNGAEAVRLAQRACDLSPEPLAILNSTLAAALAEAGRYAEAVAAGRHAVALARAAGQGEEATAYARQLRAYEAGRPFHFVN